MLGMPYAHVAERIDDAFAAAGRCALEYLRSDLSVFPGRLLVGPFITRSVRSPGGSVGVSENPQNGRVRSGIRGCRWAHAAGSLAAGTLLAATACGGAAQAKKGASDALPVNVVQVQRIELRREVEAVGTLAAKDQAVVSAEVAGRVARLGADMGDHV